MTIVDRRGNTFLRTRTRKSLGTSSGFWLAIVWLAVVAICAAVPFLVSPQDPIAQDLTNVLAPPSTSYLLGTDAVGRDVLSRLIWGARPAMIGVLIALSTALVLGILWGLIAGYVGGFIDTLLMRTADIFLAFPGIVLSIAISTILGGSLAVTMFAVGFAMSPSVARLMRAGTLQIRNREYVESSEMYGYNVWHRMLKHVFPNAVLPVLVQTTIYAGTILLAQTGLAFLGIGIEAPHPSWGASLGESFRFMNFNIWMTIIPGAVVAVTVLSFYAVGDQIGEKLSIASAKARGN